MGFDWDGVVNANVMPIFAEGGSMDPAGAANLPTYYPGGDLTQGFTLLDAVYDEGSTQVEMLGSTVQSSDPKIGVRLARFPEGLAPAEDDLIDLPGAKARYVVKVAQPDGKGQVLLLLNWAQDL